MGSNLKDRRILLLGGTGKLGQALCAVMPSDCLLFSHNSSTFAAENPDNVRKIIDDIRPDLVINTVAFMGVDGCERESEKAMQINTILPRTLAECSVAYDYMLVHFSTDAVFRDRVDGLYYESDLPQPINVYGLTKYGGDRFIQELAHRYYLFRLPILFGPTDRKSQFVERMLAAIQEGVGPLRIADDIVVTTGYTPDIAATVMNVIADEAPFGLYHLANSGTTSLYGLVSRLASELGISARIEPASYRDFPGIGRKNTRTPLASDKLVPLRSWEDAVKEYCRLLRAERKD